MRTQRVVANLNETISMEAHFNDTQKIKVLEGVGRGNCSQSCQVVLQSMPYQPPAKSLH